MHVLQRYGAVKLLYCVEPSRRHTLLLLWLMLLLLLGAHSKDPHNEIAQSLAAY